MVNSLRIMAGRIAIEARRMGLSNFAVLAPGGIPGGRPGAIRQIVEGSKAVPVLV